jgi:hypothetical protein
VSRPLPCGKPACPVHGGLCAYHGTEDDRCPYCHGTWAALYAVHRGGYIDSKGRRQPYEWTEVHSCEQPRRRYAAEATRLRREAENGGFNARQGPFCAHLDEGSTEDPQRPGDAESDGPR